MEAIGPDWGGILAVFVPILVLQLVLMAYALVDLARPGRRVKGGSKLLWAIVIIVVNIIGPLVYLFVGREEA